MVGMVALERFQRENGSQKIITRMREAGGADSPLPVTGRVFR
jgi:hypothetical protein